MIGVDTNVLAYAVNSASPENSACRAILQGERGRMGGGTPEGLAIPWSVVYEFLRLVTHPKRGASRLSTELAWGFVDTLIEAPFITVLSPSPGHSKTAAKVLATWGVCGNVVHDAQIAAVLLEHGVRRIYTRDRDFNRFAGLDVIDPLTAT